MKRLWMRDLSLHILAIESIQRKDAAGVVSFPITDKLLLYVFPDSLTRRFVYRWRSFRPTKLE